jgi:hypothetical protein
MIVELLTPLMLTTAPIQIDLPPSAQYDHAKQQSIQVAEYKNQTSYTYGTQTGIPDPYQGPKDQDTD